MKTKCAVLTETNKPLTVTYLEVPELRVGQVLVRIMYSGICGAQINEISALKGEDKFLPHLLGHEGYGTVIEVGEGVTKVKKDDNVVLTWIQCNGLDGGPKKYENCNAGPITTFQEYSVVSENRVVVVPSYDRLDRLAMFGCMIPTGYGTVLNMVEGSSIRIFGAGNIGSAAILASVKYGKKVYVVDVSKERLDYALSLGATTVNLPTDKLDKVDVAIDTTGNIGVIERAFDSIEDNGTLIIVGNSTKGSKIALSPFEFIKGKRIIGSWGGGCKPDSAIPYLMGVTDVSAIPINIYSLDNINDAIAAFKTGYCGKVLVRC